MLGLPWRLASFPSKNRICVRIWSCVFKWQAIKPRNTRRGYGGRLSAFSWLELLPRSGRPAGILKLNSNLTCWAFLESKQTQYLVPHVCELGEQILRSQQFSSNWYRRVNDRSWNELQTNFLPYATCTENWGGKQAYHLGGWVDAAR